MVYNHLEGDSTKCAEYLVENTEACHKNNLAGTTNVELQSDIHMLTFFCLWFQRNQLCNKTKQNGCAPG